MAGQNHFLPEPSDTFCSYFKANEEYARSFYSESYDLYARSGYWQQFEDMPSLRQSSSIIHGASNKLTQIQAKQDCSSNNRPFPHSNKQ